MRTEREDPAYAGQLKRADLLSAVGAGVLGGGLALVFARALGPYAVPLLVAGLVAHAVGMFAKHRLERRGAAQRLRWAEALYWLCWAALAALAVVIAYRAV